LTLTTPKVKSMVPSYVPLRTIQLLFKTFFYHSFREILMHYLKWDTLYISLEIKRKFQNIKNYLYDQHFIKKLREFQSNKKKHFMHRYIIDI